MLGRDTICLKLFDPSRNLKGSAKPKNVEQHEVYKSLKMRTFYLN